MRAGLERGERVLYFLSSHSADEVAAYLEESGVDVRGFLDSGQLSLVDSESVYLKDGLFDPDAMFDFLGEESEIALREGYAALRVTGEMDWALRDAPGSGRLMEYEAKLNRFFRERKCVAICQYDRRLFAPELLLEALATHPIAIIAGECYDNIYFLAPEEYLHEEGPESLLRRRMDALMERGHAENALRAREALLSAIEHISGVGGWEWDVEKRTMLWTEELFRIHGYAPGEIRPAFPQHSEGILHFYEAEDRIALREAFERCEREGIPFDYECSLVTAQGERIWIRASAVPVIEGGRVVRVVGNVLDITDRKRTEEALRQSEAQARRQLEAILAPPDELTELSLEEILDLNMARVLMNEFHALFDMPTAVIDLSGKVLIAVGWQDICTRYHRVHPETRKHCMESDTALVKDVKPGEIRLYRCKNGLWDVVTPIMVEERRVGNLFIGQFLMDDEEVDYEAFRERARLCGFDEGEYMAALDRVPRLNREIVEGIMSLYAWLATVISSLSHGQVVMARALVQKERLLDELSVREEQLKDFLDVAAHELRHPATLMKGYAKVLEEYGKELDEKTRKEALAAIDLGVDRLMLVVEELLDASRIERGGLWLSREQVEVKPLIKRALAEMAISGTKNDFRLEVAEEVGSAHLDPERFLRMFNILLENAVKYSPLGSPVEVTARMADGDLLVSVMDRGEGIPEEYAGRIFDRFYRREEARHHSTSSIGLGLYIARRIAEAHGGRLFYEPREGGGSVFTLSVPARATVT